MIKAGITGGIGSGKSTVCKVFELLGIPVFYADAQAKNLYDSSEELKSLIIHHFGESLYSNEQFDKNKMKEIIFNDPAKLQLLNSLVHPRVKNLSDEWMMRQTAPYALKEAALLIESGSYKEMDEIIFVECPVEIRLGRVMKRDHLTKDEVFRRIDAQMPDMEKKKYATQIIYNDDQQLIIPQVLALHDYFMKKSL